MSDFSKEEIHQTLIRRMRPMAAYAREKNIAPVIEDTPNLQIHLCSSEDLQQVLEAMPEMDMVYDSGNMLLTKEDPVEYYRQFQNRISHIHLKDMCLATGDLRRADRAIDNTPMGCAPTGTGLVDFASLCKEIKASGYEGYLTVEFAMDDSNDVPGCLRKSREYFDRLLRQ